MYLLGLWSRPIQGCKHQIQDLRTRLSAEAKANVGEEFFTVHNWANWAYIWLKVHTSKALEINEATHA